MRNQTITTRYRGDKIVLTYAGGQYMGVSIYDWRGILYYHTSANNLQEAMAYATNAVGYHHDRSAEWPSGLPLAVNPVLPQTKARHERRAKRVEAQLAARRRDRRQPQWVDGRVIAYLDAKAEDY